jgi:hypothetical protein
LFPQFPLGALQCVVLRLDLRQHLIEGVGQDSDFVPTYFVCANGIVLVVGDGACGASEPKDQLVMSAEIDSKEGRREREAARTRAKMPP